MNVSLKYADNFSSTAVVIGLQYIRHAFDQKCLGLLRHINRNNHSYNARYSACPSTVEIIYYAV